MPLRKSDTLFLGTGLGFCVIIALVMNSIITGTTLFASASGRQGTAGRLGLTDLCLFTDARYTRHLTQADRFAPYQDHPGAFEHFPSGTLAAPPGKVTNAEAPCCAPPGQQPGKRRKAGS